MTKQIEYKAAKRLVTGDLIDYGTRTAEGKRETAEVQTVTVEGKETTVTYLNRERKEETIHFASNEPVKVLIREQATA